MGLLGKAAGRELAKIKLERENLAFKPSQVTDLQAAGWMSVYEAARAVDAVPKSEKAGKLNDALKEVQRAKLGRDPKKMAQGLAAVEVAITALYAKGFGDNVTMANCLQVLHNQVKAQLA